ncbi:hypothetical protein [Amycolatopsis sp. NPDC004079]|uniref:hypothetical protein n=1 Tax=Amycolatopsis sp. NPDC004079 TaxID=3154549 RepID=UPI0033BB851F
MVESKLPDWVQVYNPPLKVWVKTGRMLPYDREPTDARGTGLVVAGEAPGWMYQKFPRADGGFLALVAVQFDVRIGGKWSDQIGDPLQLTLKEQLVPTQWVRLWTWAEVRRHGRDAGPRRFG